MMADGSVFQSPEVIGSRQSISARARHDESVYSMDTTPRNDRVEDLSSEEGGGYDVLMMMC
jgi:hypothetical protein